MTLQYIELLKIIQENPEDIKALRLLVKQAATISKFVLQKQGRYYPKLFYSCGIDIDSMAIEAVESLFISTGDTPLGIIKALQSWKAPIDNEAAAAYFVHRVVWQKTNQYVTELLQSSDPFFKKIYRNLEYLMGKTGYSKVNYFCCTYIVKESVPKEKHAFAGQEILETIPGKVFRVKSDQLIPGIFSFLSEESGVLTAVPMNALVRKLKHQHLHQYYSDLASQRSYQEADESIMKEIVDRALGSTLQKVQIYKRARKLNDGEAAAFHHAIMEMAHDLCNGGLARGLYGYLEPHCPGLSKEQFYQQYHSKLDYFQRVFKDNITKDLCV